MSAFELEGLCRSVVPFALLLGVGACSGRSSSPGGAWSAAGSFRPTTPLPASAGAIGLACGDDWEAGSFYARCGRGRRISVALFIGYEAVTGKNFRYCSGELRPEFCNQYQDSTEPPEHFQYPPTPLADVTDARDGQRANRRVLYADGPYLWIEVVVEVAQQFPSASLLITDRRLLSETDRAFLRRALGIDAKVDMDDDLALRRAFVAGRPLGAD
jgi:hypothetical protein